MVKALAAETAARGVTANCVAPGFIETAMTDALADAQKEALLGTIPAGRFGEGSDVAAACIYLASEEARYVTGQTLHVNGGMAKPLESDRNRPAAVFPPLDFLHSRRRYRCISAAGDATIVPSCCCGSAGATSCGRRRR